MKYLFVLFFSISIVVLSLSGYLWYKTSQVKPVAPAVEITPTYVQTTLDSEKLFELVNIWRTQEGLQPYVKNDYLCKIAKTRLSEIEINFSHEKFSAKRFFGDKYSQLAENLAQGIPGEQKTLDRWIASPSHLETLEHSYKYSCIETDGLYAVQIFANF